MHKKRRITQNNHALNNRLKKGEFFMARFRRNDRTNKKDNIEEVINDASTELGVDLNTKSIEEDPKDLAKRMKQAIKKRTQ